jgi:hypothetical protein
MQKHCLLLLSSLVVAGLNLLLLNNNALAQGDSCTDGYAWREAFPGDRVCVPPKHANW